MSVRITVPKSDYEEFTKLLSGSGANMEKLGEEVSRDDVEIVGTKKAGSVYKVDFSLTRRLHDYERKDKVNIVQSIFCPINRALYRLLGDEKAGNAIKLLGTTFENAEGIPCEPSNVTVSKYRKSTKS